MDTAALAAAFPFTSPDLPRDPADPDPLPGILYGANTAGPGLVAWDRWAQDNHNSVTLAASGAGKSYLAKLEILRNAYQGTECWIIDPEDEYARLAAGTGGTYLHLGADGVRLNPFDLPAPVPGTRPRADALTRQALFAHTVIGCCSAGSPARRSGPRWTGPSWPPTTTPGSPPTPAPGPGPPPSSRTWPPPCAPTPPTRR